MQKKENEVSSHVYFYVHFHTSHCNFLCLSLKIFFFNYGSKGSEKPKRTRTTKRKEIVSDIEEETYSDAEEDADSDAEEETDSDEEEETGSDSEDGGIDDAENGKVVGVRKRPLEGAEENSKQKK